jgi:hypothetical protein
MSEWTPERIKELRALIPPSVTDDPEFVHAAHEELPSALAEIERCHAFMAACQTEIERLRVEVDDWRDDCGRSPIYSAVNP